MSYPFLSDALLKVSWAAQHIDNLNGQIGAYMRHRPFVIVINDDRKARERTIRVKCTKPIPQEFSMLLGDALHNLRSALDLFYFGLVSPNITDAKKLRIVQFPINPHADANGFIGTAISRQIKAASAEVAKEIYDLKPHKDGNKYLCALHNLDIADKHKLILPVANAVTASISDWIKVDASFGSLFGGEGKLSFPHRESGILLSQGIAFTNRIALRTFKWGEQEAPVQPDFTLCFGDSSDLSGEEIVPSLVKIKGEVENAIQKMDAASR